MKKLRHTEPPQCFLKNALLENTLLIKKACTWNSSSTKLFCIHITKKSLQQKNLQKNTPVGWFFFIFPPHLGQINNQPFYFGVGAVMPDFVSV